MDSLDYLRNGLLWGHDHPDDVTISLEMDEAMLDACDQVAREWAEKDRLVDVMMDPDFQEWRWWDIPIEDLRVGQRVLTIRRTGWHDAGGVVEDIGTHWITFATDRDGGGGKLRVVDETRTEHTVSIKVPIPMDGQTLGSRGLGRAEELRLIALARRANR
jgi:hypothetical protein